MPPPNETQGVVFLLILLLLWAMTNDNGAGFVQGPSLTRERLSRQRNAHGILNTTNWGDFSPRLANNQPLFPGTEPRYLNLTGFRENDGYSWEDFGRFRNRCEEWSHNAIGDPNAAAPVWQNVSGVVRGPWVRKPLSVSKTYSSYNLSQMTPDVDWIGWGTDWSRNITGREGKMLVRVHDNEDAGTEPQIEELHQKGRLLPVEIKARVVSATVTIDDEDGSGSSSEMRLHGVHWPRQGALLLTTTSEKFAGIFAFPHLTSRQEYFESSKAVLNRTLDEMLRAKEKRYFTDHGNPWASTSDNGGEQFRPSPHCEYIFYIQTHAPDKATLDVQPALTGPENVAKAIEELEHELRFPQGAPQDGPPRLQMSALVYSPDCAFILETKGPPHFPVADGQHLQGWKQEQWLHDIGYWMLAFGAIIFCQVQLMKLQMREASTPSTLGRISFHTASMILLADGIIFSGSATWVLTATNTLLPALVMAGASCLATTVGICFLGEIYLVQEPEWRRLERDRERQAASTTNTPRPPATPALAAVPAAVPTTDANTLISTAARRANPRAPSPPIIIPSDQDIDAEIEENMNNARPGLPTPVTAPNTATDTNNSRSQPIGTIFGHLIMTGIAILFLSLAASTWRPVIRSVYFNMLAFAYLSLWTPQIYRNIYRNCRRALSWRFVIGQSVLRILPIAYFYLFKDNFAFSTPDWTAFLVLAGWLWTQIWILAAQNVLGPRFGVPKGWMPEAWEYHPILREDGVESGGLPIGLVLGSSDTAPSSPTLERTRSGGDAGKNTRIHSIDCAICREVLEVPVVKAGENDPNGGVAGVFARRAYMVTPCRHIFHSACLEGWMRFRLQCPICREELPPL